MGGENQTGDRRQLARCYAARRAIYCFKNGERIFKAGETSEIVFEAKEAGAYRVKVYLDRLAGAFDKMPWIISNPIYVR